MQKLKIGFAGLGLIGASYFNSANAQENYQPKYNTLAHKMVMIEDSGRIGSHISLEKLDKVIDHSKKFVKKTRYTKQELSDLSKKIYSTINDVDYSLAHDNDEAPLFPGDLPACYLYSLYYLGVGEANNLPFYAVNFEKKSCFNCTPEFSEHILFEENSLGHIFIRYDPNGKHNPVNPNDLVNNGDINIESSNGEIQDEEYYSDNYYIWKYDISEISLKNKYSLVNLDEKKLLGLAYGWRGANTLVYANRKRRQAKDELDKEIGDCKVIRNSYYGYNSPATQSQKEECLVKKNIEFRKDSIEKWHFKLINEAFKYLDKTIELNPNSFTAYYCKGGGYESLNTENSETNKDFALKSIENYIKAAKIAPSSGIYKKIAFNYPSISKDDCYKDIEYITKAINLDKKNLAKENMKKGKNNLEKLRCKYLSNRIKYLEDCKKNIEKSAEYDFNRCDTLKKSK